MCSSTAIVFLYLKLTHSELLSFYACYDKLKLKSLNTNRNVKYLKGRTLL